MVRLLCKKLHRGQENMGTDGITLPVWSDRRKNVASYGMGLRWKNQCGDQHPEKHLRMEKHKMVAIHASERCKRRPVQQHDMEA